MTIPRTATQAREEFKSYRAFREWFREATGGNLDIGADILVRWCCEDRADIVWLLLDATGETTYTRNTFLRAAGIALDAPDLIEAKK